VSSCDCGFDPPHLVAEHDERQRRTGELLVQALRKEALRSACQQRVDDRGEDAVISCRFVLDALDGK